jgi:hypothetical protein
MPIKWSFQGAEFVVPRKSVWEFLDNRRDLLDAKSYEVQSAVPFNIFRDFAAALSKDQKIEVTRGTASALLLLAQEFCFTELQAECASMESESLSELTVRVSKLEAQISSLLLIEERLKPQLHTHILEASEHHLPSAIFRDEQTDAQEQQLENQSSRIVRLETAVETLRSEIAAVKVQHQVNASQRPSSAPPGESSAVPGQPGTFPLKSRSPLDGIIADLTTKCGGNVHQGGIVTLMSFSSSTFRPDLSAIVDLNAASKFESGFKLDPWICWDFHKMRVSLTHYTIRCHWMKSWVIQGSVDGTK